MNELEVVIKALNDAAAALKSMTAKAKKAIANAELLAASAKTEYAKLDGLRAALGEREDLLSTKERSVLSGEALAVEQDKVAAALADLENRKKALSYEKSEWQAKYDQEKADLMTDRAALDAGFKDLEKEKQAYKEDIFLAIKKKMGI